MVAPNLSAPSVAATPSPERTNRAALSRQAALHDATLVRRFNAGDATAFVEIVTRYHARMRQVAIGVLRNRADAEEIAQDTFIRAHRGLAKFRGDSSLAAWLYLIAVNLSRNRYWYYFRRRRHATLPLDAAFSDTNHASFAEMVASDAPSPVHEAMTNEFAELVTDCMDRLPDGQREILTLRNVQQHSYGHICRSLGIHFGTTKSRIARARKNLRRLLGPIYTDRAGPTGRAGQSWFESNRPDGLLQRAGS